MKILLRRNVRKLGMIGDVVDVKPGYARNCLLPLGLATTPTAANVKKVENEKTAYMAELAALKAEAQAQAKLLEGREFTIIARANEEGNLYGSVGPAQIAATAAKDGVMLNSQDMILEEPIRRLDRFGVKVQLADEVFATVYVKVISPTGETGPVAKPAEEAPEGEVTQSPAEEAPADAAEEKTE